MKKRKFWNVAGILVIVIIIGMLIWGIGCGFVKRSDVALGEYFVSEDGKELTFTAGVMGSMGYTRGFKDEGGGVKPHYLTFYNTFGGLNSSFGAKSEFVLELEEEDSEIWFRRSDGEYELVLKKNEASGEWEKP